MPAYAIARSVRISPRKASEVAALVRGRSISDALVILEHTPRRAALSIRQAIISAKSNAEHNHNYKPTSLVITEIAVTPGVRYKRYRPAARGRALPFARKTSNIKVTVGGEKRVAKKVKPSDTKENE